MEKEKAVKSLEEIQKFISQNPEMEAKLESIMGSSWGYLALGILAPVAEELVFRGAILRSLMAYFNYRLPWMPIVVSATSLDCMIVNSGTSCAIDIASISRLCKLLYLALQSMSPNDCALL